MKKVLALLLIPLFTFSCIRVNQAPESLPLPEPATDGAFIHISKGAADTHDVLMALMLADKFSSSNDVLVFFDKEGIEMAVENAPNLEMDPFDDSDGVFRRLIDHDVMILACPACLEASGYEEADLRDGVKLAEKEKFFNFTDGRILTLDY
jgi:predicted peroxiredoxin